MELTKDEVNYLATAIDALVRRDGIQVAGMGVIILSKLQQSLANTPPAPPEVPDKGGGKEEDSGRTHEKPGV